MITMVSGDNNNAKLKILEFGSPNEVDNKSWGPGVREYYMLHIIVSGEGTFNGQSLKAGQFFYLTPTKELFIRLKKPTLGITYGYY